MLFTEGVFGNGLIQAAVGVALVILGIGAVLAFILIFWLIVWKLLLSRLGLFRALFGSPDRPSRPILLKGTRTRSGPKLQVGFTVPGPDDDDDDDDDEEPKVKTDVETEESMSAVTALSGGISVSSSSDGDGSCGPSSSSGNSSVDGVGLGKSTRPLLLPMARKRIGMHSSS